MYLNILEISETYTLSWEKNKKIKMKFRDIDGLTNSLSSLAGNRASIKVTSIYEINTDIKINNLKIKNGEDNFAKYMI